MILLWPAIVTANLTLREIENEVNTVEDHTHGIMQQA